MYLARKLLLAKMAWKFKDLCLLLKYGPVVNTCYCFTVVNVVPSGKIISQKMTAYLEEVATKKRSGENLLNEAKRMRLASLTPSVVGICVRPY